MRTVNTQEANSTVQRRLSQLMEDAGFKNPRALAKEIYNKNAFGNMTEESVYKAVQNHLRLPIKKDETSYQSVDGTVFPKGLTLDHVIGYCNFFSCSFEYLLCKTDIRTPDPSKSAICERLYLSEKAVSALEDLRSVVLEESCRRNMPNVSSRLYADNKNKRENMADPILSHPRFGEIAEAVSFLQSVWDNKPAGRYLQKLADEIGEERFAAAAEVGGFVAEDDCPSDQLIEDCGRFTDAIDRDDYAEEEWTQRVRVLKYRLTEVIVEILNCDYETPPLW